ncbi:hypothetical protein GCM10023175_36750 [Pseudonocardia xishanensis]|uniref:ParB-like nuclease family protein n=1 Tax=Pseudonocardia xishanensis TaxID=630995 RepID=A0ABP8RVT8_9PSEU
MGLALWRPALVPADEPRRPGTGEPAPTTNPARPPHNPGAQWRVHAAQASANSRRPPGDGAPRRVRPTRDALHDPCKSRDRLAFMEVAVSTTESTSTEQPTAATAPDTVDADATSADTANESVAAAAAEDLGTLMWADPAELVVGINTRSEVRLSPHFVADIRDRGVREPITVRRRDDGGLVVRKGDLRVRRRHRRGHRGGQGADGVRGPRAAAVRPRRPARPQRPRGPAAAHRRRYASPRAGLDRAAHR